MNLFPKSVPAIKSIKVGRAYTAIHWAGGTSTIVRSGSPGSEESVAMGIAIKLYGSLPAFRNMVEKKNTGLRHPAPSDLHFGERQGTA